MSSPPSSLPAHAPDASDRNRLRLMAAGLAVAAVLAYVNALHAPFVFDDYSSIVANPTIRHFDWSTLRPPHDTGQTVGGRPLLNLSLALNYAIGGLAPLGYHLFNVLLHAAAGLTLFGLVRRTGRAVFSGSSEATALRADTAALLTAAWWLLHPLQTEAVTYVSQRGEALASCWYLLTIHAFARGASDTGDSGARWNHWYSLAVAACLLGVASKEIAATAPLVVLLYDRTFLSGSFAAAWRARWRVFLALAGTWIPLGALLFVSGSRGGTAGWNATGAPVLPYLCTQCAALPHYAALIAWPHPLVFDYGTGLVATLAAAAPFIATCTLLVAAVAFALWRWPRVGFVGAFSLIVLAPSSSIVPIATQTIAEHRVYLAAAAPLALLGCAATLLAGRRSLLPLLIGAAALGASTAHRNLAYRTTLALWSDTAAKAPNNPRAHNNLAVEWIDRGADDRALAEAGRALRLDPNFAEAHNTLAAALSATGRHGEAIAQLREALRLRPDYAEAHNNLGKEWMADPARLPDAIGEFQRALAIAPAFANAETNLGLTLVQAHRAPEAVAHARRAAELDPRSFQAFNNLGIALASSGAPDEALAAFARAAALNPRSASIHENWAKALLLAGQPEAAAAQRRIAAELRGKP